MNKGLEYNSRCINKKMSGCRRLKKSACEEPCQWITGKGCLNNQNQTSKVFLKDCVKTNHDLHEKVASHESDIVLLRQKIKKQVLQNQECRNDVALLQKKIKTYVQRKNDLDSDVKITRNKLLKYVKRNQELEQDVLLMRQKIKKYVERTVVLEKDIQNVWKKLKKHVDENKANKTLIKELEHALHVYFHAHENL